MVKIRYKEPSPEIMKLSTSDHNISRSSIGLEKNIGEYYYISIKDLKPYKNQARKNFDNEELIQLADTVKTYGIRQPLYIIKKDDEKGAFEVISGERRLRAAQIAGLETVPCIIINDKDTIEELALIENIQRSDLHPIELGEAFNKILKDKKHGSVSELAAKIGKSISTVSEYSKLSNLPEHVKEFLIAKNIRTKPIFRKLLTLKNVHDMQKYLGLDQEIKKLRLKSILRVNLDNNVFKIESKQIKELTDDQKEKLKVELLKLIDHI